ncbi:energy transducer TonB [Candidatus Poribacteria bacterium]|nr:energy transducer TonB [Candidatus Poribacteria bacterium]MYH81634.1 energy transducer TonB [Candidatus Poribacteria bacterium]MYK96141.1 energy transducer TonB [Candidatus Poribacteria bacterium]
MNNAIQFLNKSVLLSICLHLIGVGIASLSIVGTPDKYGDAIIAEFVSLPKTQKTLHTPRRLKTPERTRPDIIHSQPPRIQALTEVTHIQQKELQFVVDTLPISTVHQTSPAEIGTEDERGLQDRLPPHITTGSVSQPTRFTPKRMPRPQWTSTPLAIAGTQAAELPPISALLNEPTQNAKFFRKVDPIYPESARLSHKQGLVVLEATIGVDGIARNIKVVKVVEVSGLECEEAAVAALKASQFVPAKQGKVVVSQRLRIPYRFQFKN